ncbi:MAG: tRNA pseudouridine(38-40) synthase TruA [Verrucomicrobiota bacterium]|nr:tRNA pseudouridine(38-40) synthase TruA [Verrucomicrobiota bacterium]
MAQRLKLIVAYDGAPFSGWQSQADSNAVQDHLERAVATIAGAKPRVHGAGRTDAGVHALAQCAHVDLPARTLPAEQWPLALNAHLPATIRVLRSRYVSAKFHARFSALGKTYRYRICNSRVLPPHELGRAWQVACLLDRDRLTAAATLFNGRHDFAGFAANRGKPVHETVRNISAVRVRKTQTSIIELEFSGDGFLYRMVRLMVGATVRCAIGRMDLDEISSRLTAPAESVATPRFVAPAEGLFLVRVRY